MILNQPYLISHSPKTNNDNFHPGVEGSWYEHANVLMIFF